MKAPQIDKGNHSMNEELQMELLKILYNQAFKPLTMKQYDSLVEKYGKDAVLENLYFLAKQKLIEGILIETLEDGSSLIPDTIKITAKGIDFINPDSIGNDLNAITVKIHSSSLSQIENIIKNAGLTKPEQEKLLKRLKDKGLEHFVSNLVDVGFSHLPTAYTLLHNLAVNLV